MCPGGSADIYSNAAEDVASDMEAPKELHSSLLSAGRRSDEATCQHHQQQQQQCLQRVRLRRRKVQLCGACPPMPVGTALCSALLLACCIGVIVDTVTTGYVISFVQSFLDHLSGLNLWLLTFLLLLSIILAQALAVPTAILGTGAAYVYAKQLGLVAGVFVASTVTLVGCVAGACVAFWLGRHMLQTWAREAFESFPALKRLDYALATHGFKINLLLRLSPVTPDGAINYGMSVTRTRMRDFVFAFVGIVPWLFLNSYIGAQLTDLSELKQRLQQTDAATLTQNILGLLFLFISCIVIYKYTQNALAHVQQQQQQHGSSTDEEMQSTLVQNGNSNTQSAVTALSSLQTTPTAG